MDKNYTEEQIHAMIEKIRKINPAWATKERAIRILNMLPEVSGDIAKALKELVEESEKKLPN